MTRPDDPLAIYGPADATIAALNELHAQSQARQTDYLAQLRAVVARLDANLPDEEPEPIERPSRDEPRRPTRAEREYEIGDEDLPQRKRSRGGPFGPAVRAKLVKEALRESDW